MGNNLENEFLRTRLEAKAAYKAWRSSIGKTALVREAELNVAYCEAWKAHQKANMDQFLKECEE